MSKQILRRAAPTAALAAAFALAACGGGGGGFPDASPSSDAGALADARDGAPDAPRDAARDAPAGSTNPTLLAVEPDHGPFSGGTQVTLRGSNLTQDLTVLFGDAMVQPADEMLVDSHRLVVKTPAGMVGTVDVTIQQGDLHSRVAQAFTYDSYYADPNSGSIAGGTRIALHGDNTGWTANTTVIIDAQPCTDLTVVSPNEIDCVVPAHAQGSVPITVTTGVDSATVADGFTYFESGDSNLGGFSGGHITGNLNITVVNDLTGDAVPGAFVYLGDSPLVAPPLSGVTNAMGEVTLSSADLTGPVTVTATAHCFASSTFVSIDGRDGTIFLLPWLNRVPGVDCGPPSPPSGGGGGVYAATIQGELVWAGSRETGPNPWENIPRPLANERRIAYVMTTTSSILGGTIDPGMGGTVLEVIPDNYTGIGYAYSIVARPAALAVYAIAGLQRTDVSPPRFTPYVMGVARSVLGAPAATLTHVNVDMNIPLDHELDVQLHDLPMRTETGPDVVHVANWIDLGGEGVIPRPDVALDGNAATADYRLVAQPAFLGTLGDARMIVQARYGMRSAYDDPESTVVVAGIVSPDDTVSVGNWVGIPRMVSPVDGGSLPADRQIQFAVTGNEPDMYWSVIAQGGSSCRNGFYLGDVVWWQHFFPGGATPDGMHTVSVPDISPVPTLTDIPRGLYNLSVCGFRVAGFDYNDFRYQYLSTYYWTSYATNSLTLAR